MHFSIPPIRFPKIPVIHPFAFSVYPLLFYYSYNINETDISMIYTPFLIIFTTASFLFLILRLILKNVYKAGFLTSASTLFFFSYGHIQTLTKIHDASLFPLWCALLAVSVIGIMKIRKHIHRTTGALNAISCLLILFPLLTIFRWNMNHQSPTGKSVITYRQTAQKPAPDSAYPDIYYIIAERYPSETSLKTYYQMDNSDFISYLERNNFYVAKNSKANYLITSLSLASSLNLNYLDKYITYIPKDSTAKGPVYSLISDNAVITYLKQKGYTYVHVGSNWISTIENPYADVSYIFKNSQLLNDFSEQFLKTTLALPISTILNIPTDRATRNDHRLLIDNQIEYLKKFSSIRGPKFVFAHMFLTHPPFVYDRDGLQVSEQTEHARSLEENTVNTLRYANTQYQKIIDTILANSPEDPVIILQADEGPYFDRLWKEHFYFPMPQATADELKEKSYILNAYHFPGGKTATLYPSITPVNTFRIIFNTYFGETFPLLPDKTYAHYSFQKPYGFTDITDRIK